MIALERHRERQHRGWGSQRCRGRLGGADVVGTRVKLGEVQGTLMNIPAAAAAAAADVPGGGPGGSGDRPLL